MSAWPQLTARMEGELVVVEPLVPEHEDGLFAAGHDREMWTYLSASPDAYETRERFHRWMEEALAATAAGDEGAFTIVDRASGRPIGSTRYMALRPEHRSLEIGWSWLGRPWWRTGRNVETKLLLFGRAFEQLGCERVELKCDARNARSRVAMEALPARFEGIHRRHMALPDGGWRDTAWYSVIAPEWPKVGAALRERLARHGVRRYPEPGTAAVVERAAADRPDAVAIVRAGRERIDDLERLWRTLHEHHASLAPTLGGLSARSVEDSWTRRRARYEVWLEDPEAFVLMAERVGEPVGYALVTVGEGYLGWGEADRLANVETLSVLADERGQGIGSRLMDAVEDELARAGIGEYRLVVVAPNVEALSFYERRGLEPVAKTMLGRVRPHRGKQGEDR